MNPNFQQAPYIRSQREFPHDDVSFLASQVDQAYIDIASKINVRVIGLIAKDYAMVTGKNYYLGNGNTPQQSRQKLFTFTDASLTIAHAIDLNFVDYFVSITGEFYGDISGNNRWSTLPYNSVTDVTAQISIEIDATNIYVLKGTNAPTIEKGIIIVEYMSLN